MTQILIQRRFTQIQKSTKNTEESIFYQQFASTRLWRKQIRWGNKKHLGWWAGAPILSALIGFVSCLGTILIAL